MNKDNYEEVLHSSRLNIVGGIRILSRLTTEELTGIFTQLSTYEDHKLRSLKLWNNDLSSVPTETLVAGISGLEKVNLSWTRLTTEQLTGIFTQLSTVEDHKLRNLRIGDENDLSSVPTETLVAGISGLEEVELYDTKLTKEQITGIYRMVADRKCSRLKNIKIVSDISARDISQELRDRAKLNQSVLINQQMTCIFYDNDNDDIVFL